MFFCRTAWPISTNLCTKHPWPTRIQVCEIEATGSFPKRDSNTIAKIYWQNQKMFFFRRFKYIDVILKIFSRLTKPISTHIGIKQSYDIIITFLKCFYWFKGEQCVSWASCHSYNFTPYYFYNAYIYLCNIYVMFTYLK